MVDHAQENMSLLQQLGEQTLGFGCLFHKLQLLISHVVAKHKEIIQYVLKFTAHLRGSYYNLVEILAAVDKSPIKMSDTRWCCIVAVLRYYIDHMYEINAMLIRDKITLINADEVFIVKELILLLEPIETIVDSLLEMAYVPIAFYFPILTTIVAELKEIVVTKTIETKKALLKELDINWNKTLKLAAALDPRFQCLFQGVNDFPINLVKAEMRHIGIYYLLRN